MEIVKKMGKKMGSQNSKDARKHKEKIWGCLFLHFFQKNTQPQP
jgi:hypothetical protein